MRKLREVQGRLDGRSTQSQDRTVHILYCMWNREGKMKDNFEYALQFAIEKHKGQLDKGWTPYIQHLLGVWSKVRFASLDTQIVALLHDVLEDTQTTYETLAAEFGTDIADSVQLLTHAKGLKYEPYITNI